PPLPALLSFPTRRSSDLGGGTSMTRGRGRRCRILLAGTLVLTLAAMPAAPGRTAPVEPLQHAPSRAGEWGFEAAATVIPFGRRLDRKSTRLNSSHVKISY